MRVFLTNLEIRRITRSRSEVIAPFCAGSISVDHAVCYTRVGANTGMC
jgi:hypothetical protein